MSIVTVSCRDPRALKLLADFVRRRRQLRPPKAEALRRPGSITGSRLLRTLGRYAAIGYYIFFSPLLLQITCVPKNKFEREGSGGVVAQVY